MPRWAAAKQWLKDNWFSIFASTLAFILSTTVNQGIDWYKDMQVLNATKIGLLNETKKNIAATERINKAYITFQNGCGKEISINDKITRSLTLIPAGLSSDYYLSNSQKISELDEPLLDSVYAAYNTQELMLNTIPSIYYGGNEMNKDAIREIYTLYCDYQGKLQQLYFKLNLNK